MPSMKPLPPPASVEVIAEFAVDNGTWANRSTRTNNLMGARAIWPKLRSVCWRWVVGIVDDRDYVRSNRNSAATRLVSDNKQERRRLVTTVGKPAQVFSTGFSIHSACALLVVPPLVPGGWVGWVYIRAAFVRCSSARRRDGSTVKRSSCGGGIPRVWPSSPRPASKGG